MGYVEIERERCKGCELCVEACPRHLLRLSSAINGLGYHPADFLPPVMPNGKGCTGCTVCGLVCPETAISVYR
jgi:2-oxoglutarate ferredoxin oxidoreductase subunit delta